MLGKMIVTVALVAAVGCLAAAGHIEITGSTTIYPILTAAAEAYMNQHPDILIHVEGTGSSVGIAGILEGRVDIGAASRDIKPSELAQAEAAGVVPHATVIAMDGIAVVVYPQNPVTRCNLQQLKSIYTGKSTNWREMNGHDAPIMVVSRDEASGTFEVFHHMVMKDAELWPGALVVASNQSVVDVIRQSENAVGFVGVGYLDTTLKPLLIEGELPTPESIRTRRYKLARALNLYTNGEPQGDVADFIGFLLSEAGQRIVQQEGFVPMQ